MSRARRLGDDSGASLIFALIIITVFSVIVAAILSFGDTSIRTTLALRDQAAVANSAEGAAQIAINALRRGTFDASGGQCFGGSDTLTLTNFFSPGSGPADSAAVTCDLDAGHSGVPPAMPNKPKNAVLTLSTAGTEPGVRTSVSGGRDLKVHGGIFANSTITAAAGSLSSNAAITARVGCTGTINAVPVSCAAGGPLGNDPLYAAPGTAPAVRPVPKCTPDIPRQLVPFSPGTYTDIQSLNVLSRCPQATLHFAPGTYFFDFDLDRTWAINDAYLVGGTSTPGHALVAGTVPTLPGACVSPVPPDPPGSAWTPPAAGAGVEFVFGGISRMTITGSQVELCGNYLGADPPITLYGLRSGVGTVAAQSGCVTAIPPATSCAVISTDSATGLNVHGTGYLPRAALDLSFANTSGPLFGYGVIARTLRLTPAAGADLSQPVITLPDPPPSRTVVYLTVYLCPGAATCSPGTGRQRIRAKVGLGDPTGAAVAGARWITVYSWSVQR